jgi:fimbrial chaperone protein
MLFRALALVCALITSTLAHAGAFTITPVRVDIGSGRRAASIEVVNSGQQAAQMQAERYRWKDDRDGDDELEATEDFIVTPPIFSLEPGQRQIVRVLMQAPSDPVREIAYRLILQETPLGDPQANTVATVLRISLPVFVTPPRAKSELIWSLRRESGRLFLDVENQGGAHASITSLKTADGTVLKSGIYVLSGGRRSWPISAPVDSVLLTLRDGDELPAAVRPAP